MDEIIASTIAKLHNEGYPLCLTVAGAGSQALAWLLAVPGGSRTLLEGLVPYNRASLCEYLGFEPEKYASAATAVALAARAAQRAQALHGPGAVGVSCTAALATDPPRRGSHRATVARWDGTNLAVYELILQKGRRDRAGEEWLVSLLVLRAILDGAGIDAAGLALPDADEILEVRTVLLHGAVSQLLAGTVPLLVLEPSGRLCYDASGVRAVMPGSFNPLHTGHRELAATAAHLLGTPVCFEIAAHNPDKPTLDATDLLARLSQFAGWAPVALTSAPLFVEKARSFPQSTFVVGADTAARLVQPRYYGGEAAMDAAFAQIRGYGCAFLVAGRHNGDRFVTLADLGIPEGLRDLFQAIPAETFRADISSTKIRAAQAQVQRTNRTIRTKGQ